MKNIKERDPLLLLSLWLVAKVITVILVLCLVIYFGTKEDGEVFGAPRYGTERYWQDIIHEELSQKDGWGTIEKEYRLDDGTRVDLLLQHQACEIDWADKWAEGIGQSIYYGLKTDRDPLVLLLAKKDGWEKYRDRVEYCGIKCWVYDTRIQDWVDKE
tara:strand:- start:2486 stop:2959 length:474 start_codon:yes stop_codon:yes gene_type:complete